MGKMKANMIKLGSGAVGILVAGMALLSLGVPAGGSLMSADDAWAVIFATDETGTAQVDEGWALHEWLLDHGWQDDHIVFLADHEGADGEPSLDNIHDAISDVASVSGEDSLVFISALDEQQWSDGHVYFHTSDGLLSEDQLGLWVNEITTYGKMGIEVSGKYTGAFIPPLVGHDRVIATSHASTESCDTNNYRLSVGLGISGADYNGDHHVSLQEAHAYQCMYIMNHYKNARRPRYWTAPGTSSWMLSSGRFDQVKEVLDLLHLLFCFAVCE